ncbi:SMP-30/gluconolactonase/LRE family protein [Algoriphagus sp.]|uniref:SMP-30/gluconolactonase/LRE family protein n=1 Tax=Algoriphagus sp. TaxID=1872435 RepID=UPI0025DA241E|nr:SMP-30/gluconolactonase/LRE family protein [Algoriphagus sp.]
MRKTQYLLFILAVVFSCKSPETKDGKESANTESSDSSRPNYSTTGNVERLDSEIDQLIPIDSKIEIIASGFDWSEGPLWLEVIDALIFSDVPQNRIWKWTEQDSLEIYLEPSGYFGNEENKREPGSNGLVLDINGDLLLCQHGARQLAVMKSPIRNPSGNFVAIANQFEGKKFNSPNDLVINNNGGMYFTDPPYGLDEWDTKELDFQGVYFIDFRGNLSLQIDSLSRPNGIGLSPDEKSLFIAQSDPMKARYYRYELDENGNVFSGKIIFDVTNLVGEENPGLPDGLAVHSSGNLFASGPGGILIISPEGKHLGTIKTGRATSNCTFDFDEEYLYITADMDLLRIKLK